MRGNLKPALPFLTRMGSIPAHAGEPATTLAAPTLGAVYPRACGGTRNRNTPLVSAQGLSPRMRGNREGDRPKDGEGGSIPAHAGEPESGYVKISHCGVYPRACGGTLYRIAPVGARQGLSPRMRGNLGFQVPSTLRNGSIPAHAGEPPLVYRGAHDTRVYPRACGGTAAGGAGGVTAVGLSPRMRGNP